MRYGSQREAFEEQREANPDAPSPLDNRPEAEHLYFYWNAFLELATCRAIGMGVGSIPWTAYDQWANANGITGTDRWVLWVVLRKMDRVYLDHVEAERKRKAQQAENKAKRKGRR